MALTPQMRHSIKLLGMSTKDINEYIESAIESNPFLQKTYNKKNDSEIGVDFSSVKNSDYSYSQSHENKADSVDPRQSLMSQLRMLNLDDSLAKIAEQLVYDMDENGYITVSLDDIAHDFSASLEEVEETLGLIQTLDPAGIGARDITECLRIQLERMGKDSASLEYRIVGDFLSEIARDDVEKIAKALGTNKESVKKLLRPSRSLIRDLQVLCSVRAPSQ